MKKRLAKTVCGIVILMASTAALAAEARAGSCEIAVPKASDVFGVIEWTVRDNALRVLANRGYEPYNVESLAQVSSGLYLSWGWSCQDHWYGKSCTYRTSVRRWSAGRDFLVGASTGSSLEDALDQLPFCNQK